MTGLTPYHARLIDPASKTDVGGAVLIEGKIIDGTRAIFGRRAETVRIVDARTARAGLIDVHLNPVEHKESFEPPSAAAAAGGVTPSCACWMRKRRSTISFWNSLPAAPANQHRQNLRVRHHPRGNELSEFGILNEAGRLPRGPH